MKSFAILKELFNNEDYEEFLTITNGHETEIKQVNIAPILNFNQEIIRKEDMILLVQTYQYLKYYLEQRGFYTPKMQEGLALCASKVAIINYLNSTSLDSYFKMGNRNFKGEKGNPFEEIVRLLLMATKDDCWSNNFKRNGLAQDSLKKLDRENASYLNIVKTALDKDLFEKEIRIYCPESTIDDIGLSLEQSNINSTIPSSAGTKENKDVILSQCDRIADIYSHKLDYKIVIGEMLSSDFHNKLLSRFDTAICYTKRNIGVYEPTKMLMKEN